MKVLDRELAERHGCDIRTIVAWRKKGAPLDDNEAMGLWLEAQRTGPSKGEAKDIHAMKLRLITLQCERLAMGNEETKGDLVQKKTVTADLRVIAAAIQSRLTVLIGECPAWSGLRPHELQSRAKEFVKQTHELFNDKAGSLYGPI